MPISFGTSGIGEIYYGNTPIKEVYAGSQLVWSSTPAVNPLTFGASTWLTFTDSAEDFGVSPQSWTQSGGTFTDGYLAEGQADASSPVFPWTNTQGVTVSVWSLFGGGNPTVAEVSGSNFNAGIVARGNISEVGFHRQHGATSSSTTAVPASWAGLAHLVNVLEPVSGTTWRQRCYINGVEVANGTWNAGTQSNPTSPSLRAGLSGTGRGVDDFALFPSALSAADVDALYAAGRTGPGYYPPEPEPGSWPQTGSWSGNTTPTLTALDTFTVTESGVYDLEWSVTWDRTGSIYGKASLRVNTGSWTDSSVVITGPGTGTASRTGAALSVGDVVSFAATSVAGTRAASGAWTVNKTG